MTEKPFGKFYKPFVPMVPTTWTSWILGLCLNFKITFSIFGSLSYFNCPFGEAFNRQTILAIVVILYLIIFLTRELSSLELELRTRATLFKIRLISENIMGSTNDVPWLKKSLIRYLIRALPMKYPSSVLLINSTF